MSYRVRCKRRARAKDVRDSGPVRMPTRWRGDHRRNHLNAVRSEMRERLSGMPPNRPATRRAWPAVSRKDAERIAWTEFVDGLGLPGRGDTP